MLVGRDGSISSYDYDGFVTLQTRAALSPVQIEADPIPAGRRGPVEYMLARLADGGPIEGPLDPALSLIGQRIIDSAVQSSAREARGGAGAMSETDLDTYALKASAAAEMTAPDLPYRPPLPRAYRPRIALGRGRGDRRGAPRRLPRGRASTSR